MRLFEKNRHAIIWGDAIEALSGEIPDSTVDLIFADPPYNIGKNFNGRKDRWPSDEAYLSWCYEWLELCVAKLKPHGSLYVMTATQNMPYFDIFLRQRLHILTRIVWAYDSSGVQARKYFGSLYEPILFCVKDTDNYTFNADDILVEARTGATRKLIDYRKSTPTVYNSKKIPGNVWNIPRVRYRMEEYENHPTQKPTALLDRIIRASSNPETSCSIRSPEHSLLHSLPRRLRGILSVLRSRRNTSRSDFGGLAFRIHTKAKPCVVSQSRTSGKTYLLSNTWRFLKGGRNGARLHTGNQGNPDKTFRG